MKVELMPAGEIAHDIIPAREGPAPKGWSGKLGWRQIAASFGYVALYLALDGHRPWVLGLLKAIL